jgi:hypothetical protein
MSHRTEVDAEFLDKDMVKKTCEELGVEFIDEKKVKLFEGTFPCEYSIRLKGWSYAVGIQENGKALFDNYNGGWGDEKDLDSFRQRYTENVTLHHAAQAGYRVLHREMNNGTLRIEIQR